MISASVSVTPLDLKRSPTLKSSKYRSIVTAPLLPVAHPAVLAPPNVEPTGREARSETTLANGPRWAPCYVALPRQFRRWNSNTIGLSSFGNGNLILFEKFLLEHDGSFGAKNSHKIVRFPIRH